MRPTDTRLSASHLEWMDYERGRESQEAKGRGFEPASCVCATSNRHTIYDDKSGGGGNRTRVPRYFSASFYVRRRMISAFRPLVPNRRGSLRASPELCLAAGIPGGDPRRFGFGNRLLGLSE